MCSSVRLQPDQTEQMDRREFLKTAGAAGAASALPGMAHAAQPAALPQGDRGVWIAVMRRLADPVLTNL
jgi:hypothetical protein